MRKVNFSGSETFQSIETPEINKILNIETGLTCQMDFAEGIFKPMACNFINKDNFDCRPYIQNAIKMI